ncbi:hypothetical protein PQR46_07240 [Paraburkholderia sediminicola]|uniref:hypothetical protein n=1 Tax=Paraburkholderia sediminicola TaxID=458836 RepID=UPI0038B9F831
MASIKLCEAEMQALYGLGYEAIALYVMAIRPRMDFATGMVGIAPRISWQALREWIYVEPRQGVKAIVPSIEAIRRIARQLEKAGLLRCESTEKNLVFRVLLAETDSCVQKKADRKPTGQADTRKPAPVKAQRPEADRGRPPKADTHPVSGEALTNTSSATTYVSRADEATEGGGGGDALIWPENLEATKQAAMATLMGSLAPDLKQQVLDEWQGAMQAGGIRYPAKFFASMINDAKSGVFMPEHAGRVCAGREARKKQLAEMARRDAAFSAQVAESARSLPPGGSIKAMLSGALKRPNERQSTAQ